MVLTSLERPHYKMALIQMCGFLVMATVVILFQSGYVPLGWGVKRNSFNLVQKVEVEPKGVQEEENNEQLHLSG